MAFFIAFAEFRSMLKAVGKSIKRIRSFSIFVSYMDTSRDLKENELMQLFILLSLLLLVLNSFYDILSFLNHPEPTKFQATFQIPKDFN